MKKIILILGLFTTLAAFANIDASTDKGVSPTSAEVSQYRACFQELEQLGCGHPSEDQEHFVNCMHDSLSSLTKRCQEMMTTLYGTKSSN